jgi:hypothetical protein
MGERCKRERGEEGSLCFACVRLAGTDPRGKTCYLTSALVLLPRHALQGGRPQPPTRPWPLPRWNIHRRKQVCFGEKEGRRLLI